MLLFSWRGQSLNFLKLIRHCFKTTCSLFRLLFPQTDGPFIIICYLLHKSTDGRKYCQRHPKSCPKFHCLFDEWVNLMICLRISFSLAAVCLCVHMYVSFFYYWPVFPSSFLTVFVVACLALCLMICMSAHESVLVSQKNKIPCQRNSLWQADGSEILLTTLLCSSILLTFHIYSISTYSVRTAFLPCILFGLVSERRDGGRETKAKQALLQPLNRIRVCCWLIKEKGTWERRASALRTQDRFGGTWV